MTVTSRLSDLDLLMALADRFAHKLATDDAEVGVLLVERDGDLTVTPLHGTGHDAAARMRLLLAGCRATSAALVIRIGEDQPGGAGHALYILGETADGARAERMFRIKGTGRRPRLGAAPAAAIAVPERLRGPLFVRRQTPPAADLAPPR